MENHVNPWRVLTKGVLLYLIFEIAFFHFNFDPGLLNIYRIPALKWERFPFRSEPDLEHVPLDVGVLDTLFESHVISEPKQADEFRVILLGDSGMWGAPLPPDAMLSSQINALNLSCASKHVTVYNLAYPWPSAIKDILILDRSLEYEPDLVIWSVTLLTVTTQLVEDHPLFSTTESELHELMTRLRVMERKFPPVFFEDQLIQKQTALYRTLRFQLYEFIRLAREPLTEPEFGYVADQELGTDETFFDLLEPPTLQQEDLSLNLIDLMQKTAGDVPVIVMNEPIAIAGSDVPNSDKHYNVYFPRWAYDQYREYMNAAAQEGNWHYLDYWNTFPPEYFSDSPLHLTREGEKMLAEKLAPTILEACNQ